MMTRRLHLLVLGILLLAVPRLAWAQAEGAILDVKVRDMEGGVVTLATVIVEGDSLRQHRVTGDSGTVSFALARQSAVRVSVRRIGYRPAQTTVVLRAERQAVTLTISRTIPWALDTVRVLADRAVTGIVVSAATQEPIAMATITLAGMGQRVTSGEDGAFTLPLRTQRNVTLSVRAPGYAPLFRTERLEDGTSGSFLILLDPAGAVPSYIVTNLWDAERRLAWRSVTDVVIGGRELRATGASNVQDALLTSRSRSERGIRVGDNLCLFVNGEPAPGQTLESFPVDQVRTLELYERGGDMIKTLVDRWPKNALCGRGQAAVAPTGPGAARYAVVWTY